MKICNIINEQGEVVRYKVRLTPSLPDLPAGHKYVPYEPSQEEAIQQIILAIRNKRDYKLANGGYKVNDKWFHSDSFSRTQHLGLTMLGQNLPNNIDWKTMDGSFMRLTPAVVQQLFAQAVTQDNAIFAHAEYLTQQVREGQNPNISIGWPETYGNV